MAWGTASLTSARQSGSRAHVPSWRWIAMAMAAALLLECFGWAMFPLRAWLVASHEFFHALAGWLTGGVVESIQARSMEGVTYTSGGFYPFISCAGYVGSGMMGAACLRWCAEPKMRISFMVFCTFLGAALVAKGKFGDGYAWGMACALAVDALALWGAWTAKGRWAPFVMALAGCLFLSTGFEDVRTLLIYATGRTDAGLLARHWGLPFLAWPIALCYAIVMAAMWWWALASLARDVHRGDARP